MTFLPILVRGVLTSSKLRLAFSRARQATSGQDLVEYALLGGFVATAAAAIFPDITYSLQYIMCEVTAYLAMAASTDGHLTDITGLDGCIQLFD